MLMGQIGSMPSAPALQAAATRSGPAMPPIGACRMGILSPSSLVRRICRIMTQKSGRFGMTEFLGRRSGASALRLRRDDGAGALRGRDGAALVLDLDAHDSHALRHGDDLGIGAANAFADGRDQVDLELGGGCPIA